MADQKIEIILPGSKANKTIPKRKLDYAKKLRGLLQEYDKCIIVTVDNVGSKQIAEMRKDFRGQARFLFGKNTLIRKVIRDFVRDTKNTDLKKLMDLVKGNCGFCFTKADVKEMTEDIVSRKVQCPAKAGVIAPCDVRIPPGPTGMEPTQTATFQAMNIPTRINRGQIDIVDEVHLIHEGQKVGASEAQLLVQLGIRPFYYGMKVKSIYENGEAYDAAVLKIDTEQVAQAFYRGLRNVSALCFALNYPTIINVPHSVLNGYKKVIALGLELKTYSWEGLETIREVLKNPGAFSGGGGGGAPAAGGDAPAAAQEEEESEEEESAAAAPGLFGGDDDSSDDDSSSD